MEVPVIAPETSFVKLILETFLPAAITGYGRLDVLNGYR